MTQKSKKKLDIVLSSIVTKFKSLTEVIAGQIFKWGWENGVQLVTNRVKYLVVWSSYAGSL